MKVSGLGSGQRTDRSKRTAKTDAGRSEFRDSLSGSVDAADGVDSTGGTGSVDSMTSLSGVDTLLALQSVDDVNEREARKRTIRRGEDILDQLEELRRGLIIGTFSPEKLENLAKSVRTSREDCGDPRLGSILDEIELRAEVELAKMGRFNPQYAA